MKGLLLVAGLASAVAVISGVFLVTAGGRGSAGDSPSAAGEGAASPGGPSPEPSGGGPGAYPEPPPGLEERLRALEERVEALQAQVYFNEVSGGGPRGGGAAPTGFPGTGGEASAAGVEGGGAEGSSGDEGLLPTGEGAAAEGPASTAGRLAEAKRRAQELKREMEIRRRIELLATALSLDAGEKSLVEDAVRRHVEEVDALGARAKEVLKQSTFGITPGDKGLLEQLEADRRRIDGETEQALVGVLGADRWKRFRRAAREQNDKERTLRRLGQPW